MTVRRVSNQSVLGVVVVLVGLALLASTTGTYDTTALLRYTPSLLVLVGLYALVRSGFRNLVGPLALVVGAGLAQLVVLDVLAAADLVDFWPLAVVALGVSLLAGQVRARVRDDAGSRVDAFALLGGNERRATSETFHGGKLTALFGAVELDLRDTVVVDRPARIDATALFGAVEIIVPREWTVDVDVLPLLGAAEDERPRRVDEHDEVDLVVTGLAAFGAVSVRD